MKKIFNDYIFHILTGINTVQAFFLIAKLFTPAATPATAFFAIIVSIIAIGGWITIAFEHSRNKINAQYNAKLARIKNERK